LSKEQGGGNYKKKDSLLPLLLRGKGACRLSRKEKKGTSIWGKETILSSAGNREGVAVHTQLVGKRETGHAVITINVHQEEEGGLRV